MNKIQKIVGGLFFFVMTCITWLLLEQYFYFRQQSDKMLDLQKQYHIHISDLKKNLYAFDNEKKKNNVNESLALFPEGARVFSSDDYYDSESFTVINRELDYLKKLTVDHIKDQNLKVVLQRLDFDEWQEYTEHVKNHINKAYVRPKKKTNKKPFKKSYSYKSVNRDMLFTWPIDRSQFWLSSLFGKRKKPNGSWGFHSGIDMAALKGTPVKAAAGGTVIEARYAQGYGNTVVIKHNNKYKTRYAHLDKIIAKKGQKVSRGQLIGKVGDTGFVRKSGKDASHLHFELYAFGKKINPLYLIV